jgi:hypothetical protein
VEHWRWRDALEAEGCIGGIGGAWRQMELLELMELEVSTKCQRRSKQSELVRTCQNWMGLVWGYFCCM